MNLAAGQMSSRLGVQAGLGPSSKVSASSSGAAARKSGVGPRAAYRATWQHRQIRPQPGPVPAVAPSPGRKFPMDNEKTFCFSVWTRRGQKRQAERHDRAGATRFRLTRPSRPPHYQQRDRGSRRRLSNASSALQSPRNTGLLHCISGFWARSGIPLFFAKPWMALTGHKKGERPKRAVIGMTSSFIGG